MYFICAFITLFKLVSFLSLYVNPTLAQTGSVYQLDAEYSGANFFQGWDFYTGGDPTGGFVTYYSQSSAQLTGLVNASANTPTYIGADFTNTIPSNGAGRPSVRIATKKSWTHGLFIGDFAHAPGGICGTWPAFWTLGPNWPYTGEIDIMEGVNQLTNNAMTLHASPNCTIAGDVNTQTGQLQTSNCAYYPGYNVGCGITDNRTQSYGTAFNSIGGGVYAMQWTSDYIRIWYFQRSQIPQDILNKVPNPSNWGKPAANMQGSCIIDQHFQQHKVILDNTFCGEYAGVDSVWNSTLNSCAISTGYSTCNAFVAAQPSAFQNAYWSINSIRVYQLQDSNSNTSSTSTPYIASLQPSTSTSTIGTAPASSPTASYCPTYNFTIIQAGSYKYEIECGVNPSGADLGRPYPSYQVRSFEDCVAGCSYWNTYNTSNICGAVAYQISSQACYWKKSVGSTPLNPSFNGARLIYYAYPQITDNPNSATTGTTTSSFVSATVSPQTYSTTGTTSSTTTLVTASAASSLTNNQGMGVVSNSTATMTSTTVSQSTVVSTTTATTMTTTMTMTSSTSSRSISTSSLSSSSAQLSSSTSGSIASTSTTTIMSTSSSVRNTSVSTTTPVLVSSTSASISSTSGIPVGSTSSSLSSITSTTAGSSSNSIQYSATLASSLTSSSSSSLWSSTSSTSLATTLTSLTSSTQSAAVTTNSSPIISTAISTIMTSTIHSTTSVTLQLSSSITSQIITSTSQPLSSSSSSESQVISSSTSTSTGSNNSRTNTSTSSLSSTSSATTTITSTNLSSSSSNLESTAIFSSSNIGFTSSSSAPSPPGPSIVESFRYAGCKGSISSYTGFELTEDSPFMTIEKCISGCHFSIYAGVYSTSCYCGDSIDATVDFISYPDGNCNTPCPGNPNEKCGGIVGVEAEFERRQVASGGDDIIILLTVYNNTNLLPGELSSSTTNASIISSSSLATSNISPVLTSTQSPISTISLSSTSVPSAETANTDSISVVLSQISSNPIPTQPQSQSQSESSTPITLTTTYTSLTTITNTSTNNTIKPQPTISIKIFTTTMTVFHCVSCPTHLQTPSSIPMTTLITTCPCDIENDMAEIETMFVVPCTRSIEMMNSSPTSSPVPVSLVGTGIVGTTGSTSETEINALTTTTRTKTKTLVEILPSSSSSASREISGNGNILNSTSTLSSMATTSGSNMNFTIHNSITPTSSPALTPAPTPTRMSNAADSQKFKFSRWLKFGSEFRFIVLGFNILLLLLYSIFIFML